MGSSRHNTIVYVFPKFYQIRPPTCRALFASSDVLVVAFVLSMGSIDVIRDKTFNALVDIVM